MATQIGWDAASITALYSALRATETISYAMDAAGRAAGANHADLKSIRAPGFSARFQANALITFARGLFGINLAAPTTAPTTAPAAALPAKSETGEVKPATMPLGEAMAAAKLAGETKTPLPEPAKASLTEHIKRAMKGRKAKTA